MKTFLTILTFYYALLSIVPFLRSKDRSVRILLWVPKLFAGALSPIIGIVCGLGAVLGLTRRNWKLAGAGILGAGLAAKFVADIPASQDQFETVFGPDWQERIPTSIQPFLLPRRVHRSYGRLSWGAPGPDGSLYAQPPGFPAIR